MFEKKCRDCGTSKPLVEFDARKDAKDGLSNRCKACRRLYLNAWSKSNPDKKRGYAADWRASNPDAVRASERRMYEAHPVTVRAKFGAAHRLRQVGPAAPRWVDRAALRAVYRTAIERSLTTGTKFHVDHIVPLRHPNVSGLHVPWNLQVIPASENSRKRNRFDG